MPAVPFFLRRSRAIAPLLLLAALLPALAPAQKVVAWGDDTYGELDTPMGLIGPVQVGAGSGYSMALRPNGTVAAWGFNGNGNTTVPAGLANVAQIFDAPYNSYALKTDGTVAVWGDNNYGESNVPAGLSGVVNIGAGAFHGLAAKSDGTVVGWGRNANGEATPPAGLSGVVEVAAGDFFSLAVKSDGTVTAWGYNGSGQTTVPAGLSHVAQVAAGTDNSLALKTDGTVTAWGDNTYGQSTVPSGLYDVTQISTSFLHCLALKSDGTVVAWGYNNEGECNVPAGLTGVLQVSAGLSHSLALVAAAHCVLDQKQITAGGSATGTVKLADPAPAGGAVVGLTCSGSTVHVPDSVTVPEGATSATFPVTTDVDYAGRQVTIQTSYNGTPTVPAKLIVLGVGVGITANHPVIYGGSTTKELLTLTLDTPLETDQTFHIENFGGAEVSTPGSVTVKAGKTSVNFYVVPALTSTEADTQILVYNGGAGVASVSLTVKPISGTVALAPYDLFVADVATGTITLNAPVAAPLAIPLSVSRPIATLPASVTVPAGSKTASFSLTAGQVTKFTSAVLSAQINGNTSKTTLHITPRSNLLSVSLPTYLYGDQQVTVTVKLSSPAPAGGETVAIAASDLSLTVPESIVVPAGATSATFVASGADVTGTRDVTVTATQAGASVSAATQIRPLAISSFALSASTVSGGTTVTGTVNLNVAVAVDTTVDVTSDNPGVASTPATVTIPAGSRTGTFTISTTSPATDKNVKIAVSKNGTSAYRTLKVTP